MKISFEDLSLHEAIQRTLKKKGYVQPTPVQEKAIPSVLQGNDLFCSAQTGTGKTAAFALPLIQLLSASVPAQRKVRALVLAPTRELALQISQSFEVYGQNLGTRVAAVFGGVSQSEQTRAIRKGVDVIVATPGRLLDLMNQGQVQLSSVEYLVLDEADRMLDMGFIPDIRRIIAKVPSKRQSLLFSATMPQSIRKLAGEILKNPVYIEIQPATQSTSIVDQTVYFVNKNDKADLLYHLLKEENIRHALVFSRTKRGADRLAKRLDKNGIRAQAIHGDRSQRQRQHSLNDFANRKLNILVATDVASRGIDVKELSHVINFDLPEQPETYTHRIGRTGRAGLNGIALSFCSPDEKAYFREIQKSMKNKIKMEYINSNQNQPGAARSAYVN